MLVRQSNLHLIPHLIHLQPLRSSTLTETNNLGQSAEDLLNSNAAFSPGTWNSDHADDTSNTSVRKYICMIVFLNPSFVLSPLLMPDPTILLCSPVQI